MEDLPDLALLVMVREIEGVRLRAAMIEPGHIEPHIRCRRLAVNGSMTAFSSVTRTDRVALALSSTVASQAS
ncbi:MAG: hypothetical protein AAGA48_19350 [Myxococcota bacterium]